MEKAAAVFISDYLFPMKQLLSLLLLFVGSMLTACDDNDVFRNRLKGEGPTVSESRSVAAFSGLDLNIDADVYLTQGTEQSVRVEGQRNMLDILRTDVRDGRLSIKFDYRGNLESHDAIRVYITLPTLTSVSVSGSGQVQGEGLWGVQDLSLNVNGSGGINFPQLGARDLRTSIAGFGNVRLGGDVRRHRLEINGSGEVNAFELTQATADVRISGSGNTRLHVTQALDATINGSGTVYYRGQPTVTPRVSGSGRVINSN